MNFVLSTLTALITYLVVEAPLQMIVQIYLKNFKFGAIDLKWICSKPTETSETRTERYTKYSSRSKQETRM